MTEKHIFPLSMAFIMAFIMSAVFALMQSGLSMGFPMMWAHKFLIAWPCASVAVFIALPIAKKMTVHIVGWVPNVGGGKGNGV